MTRKRAPRNDKGGDGLLQGVASRNDEEKGFLQWRREEYGLLRRFTPRNDE